MSIHPQLAARFRHLDGLTSMREAYTTMAGLEKIRRFDNWEPATTLPTVTTRDMAAPGPHGPVPVRVYEPPVGVLADLPCLVWLHGGGFAGGDLEMNEADWTAREVCGRAGAVVVSVDYRLAQGEINYPVPHDDAVAAVAWVRDSAAELGVDPARITLGGASAGGNLSAGAALKLRDRDAWMPSALLLVYAVFHPVVPAPSRSLAALLAELPTVYQEEPGNDTSFVTVNYLGDHSVRRTATPCPASRFSTDCARLCSSTRSTTTCDRRVRHSPLNWLSPAWTYGRSWYRRCCTRS